MDIFRGLNSRQVVAAGHIDGPVLVIAGAGTGKTMVIGKRIANLVLNKKIDPKNILALTFTEKAAYEMQDRVEQLLPYGIVTTNIMTFHALGDEIIREHGLEIGLNPDISLVSGFSQIIFIKQIFNKFKLDYYAPLSNPYKFINALIEHFSRLKDEMVTPKNYLEFAKKLKNNATNKEQKVEAKRVYELAYAYDIYTKCCMEESKFDHGDQIILAIELLKKRPNILAKYQERFQYILVDEYQDTNFAQNELLNLLAKKTKNIMVVGDDDQSIYRFRGAAISNILKFRQKFLNCKQIVLNQNYRSSQKILDTAYKLIQFNNPDRLEIQNKIDKHLIGKKSGSKPIFLQFETKEEEMVHIAKQIKLLIKKGTKASDIAILVRKNSQLQVVSKYLSLNNINHMLSQNENLFLQPEVLSIINFINSLNDPRDSKSLFGLMAGDIFNVKITTLIDLNAQASRAKLALEQYLLSGIDIPGEIDKVLQTIMMFRELSTQISSGQIVYKFLQDSNYLKKLKKKAVSDNSSAIKIQNIAKFFDLIKEFEGVSHNTNLHHFWQYLDQVKKSGVDIMAETSPLDLDMVQVLTVHKAKGLEFSAVFIPDMINQTFPSKRQSRLISIPEKLIKISSAKDWHIEEERRLFYVGITRAKKHLTVTMSYDHGTKRRKKISPFIFEAFGDQNIKLPSKKYLPFEKIENPLSSAKTQKYDLVQSLYRNGWLHLNVHQIDDYLRNPLEFWYMHVLKIPREPHHSLVYGSAIHKAVEHYFAKKIIKQQVRLNDLYKIYKDNWVSEGFISFEHEKQRFNNGKKLLKNFFESQKTQIVPIISEQSFEIKLSDLKVIITGRYDAIYEYENGQIEIRDFKTSQKDNLSLANNALKKSIQLAIYGLAWEKTTGKPPDKLSLHFLENDLIVSTDKIDNNKIFVKIKEVAEGIKKRDFKPTSIKYLSSEEMI